MEASRSSASVREKMIREKMHFFIQSFADNAFCFVDACRTFQMLVENDFLKSLRKESLLASATMAVGSVIAGSSAGILPGASVSVRNLLILGSDFLSKNKREVEAKRVIRAYDSVTKDDFQFIVLNAGAEIFRSFERQIVESSNETRVGREVLNVLSLCAVRRAMNYVAKNENVVGISTRLIVEGVVFSGKKVLKPLIEYNGKEVHPHTIYVGEKSTKGKETTMCSSHVDCSYRLPFTFEEKCSITQESEYEYVLKDISIEEESKIVAKKIEKSRPATRGDLDDVIGDKRDSKENGCQTESSVGSSAYPRGGGDDKGGGGRQSPGSSDGQKGLVQCYQGLSIKTSGIEFFAGHSSSTGGGESTLQCAENDKAASQRNRGQFSKSVFFMVQDPVLSFVGREKELEILHNKIQHGTKKHVSTLKVTCISGFSGIGKTQLARKYVQRYANDYDRNIIWINAESESKIRESFHDLAGKISEKPEGNQTTETEKDVIAKVYSFFASKKSLFVFDGVKVLRSIEEFLPLYITKPNDKKPWFLITSRCVQPQVELLKLESFSSQDAELFLKEGLEIRDDSQKEEVRDLICELGYFPLAIQQAISYILHRKQEGDFNIGDYLQEYMEKKRMLLDSNLSLGIGDIYTNTTFGACQSVIDTISGSKEHGKLALEILNIASCLNHENIVGKMFLSLAENDQSKLESAFQLLIKYSVVKFEEKQGLLGFHKPIQEVVNLRLAESGEKEKFLRKTLELLNETHDSSLCKYFPYKEYFLSNLESFLYFLDSAKVTKNFEEEEIEKDFIAPLLALIAKEYLNICDFEGAGQSLQRAMEIQERYNINNEVTIDILLSLSQNYEGLEDYNAQKVVLFRAFTIMISSFQLADYNYRVGSLAVELGQVCQKVGSDCKIAVNEILCFGLDILRKYYHPGDPHFRTIGDVLVSVGQSYGDLGLYEEEKKRLIEALYILEKECGLDHFNVNVVRVKLSKVCKTLGHIGDSRLYVELATRNLKTSRNSHPEVRKLLSKILEIERDLDDSEIQDNGEMDYCESMLNLIISRYGMNSPEKAEWLLVISVIYKDLGDDFRGFDCIEECVRILEESYGDDKNSKVIKARIRLADAYYSLDKYIEGMDLIETKVLPFLEKDPYHFQSLGAKLSLARGYEGLKEYAKQVDLIKKDVLPFLTAGFDEYESSRAKLSLARGYGGLRSYTKQVDLIEEVLDIFKKHDKYEVPKLLLELAEAYGNLGNYQEKRNQLKKAIDFYKKVYLYTHQVSSINYELMTMRAELGKTHSILKEYYQAVLFLEGVLPILKECFNPLDKKIVEVQVRLADAYSKLGFHDKEKKFLEDTFFMIDIENIKVNWASQGLDQLTLTIIEFYKNQTSAEQCSGGIKRPLGDMVPDCSLHKRVRREKSMGAHFLGLHCEEQVAEQEKRQPVQNTCNSESMACSPFFLNRITVEPLDRSMINKLR